MGDSQDEDRRNGLTLLRDLELLIEDQLCPHVVIDSSVREVGGRGFGTLN
jgi:hypothetical protein